MPRYATWLLPRFRIALALCALNALVAIPWLLVNWGASALGVVLLAVWLALAALVMPVARGLVAPSRCAVLLIAGLLLSRGAALLLVGDAEAAGDAGIYPDLARTLIAGGGLLFHDPVTGVTFRALFPPVYPLLLAGIGGLAPLATPVIWATNVLLDLLSMGLVVRLGTRMGSTPAGYGAAWLFAIWPAFAMAAPFANKEGLVTTLVLGIATILVGPRRAAIGWRDPVLLGLAVGLLMLTQPGLVLLPAILALFLLPVTGFRRMASLCLRAVPFALLPLLPWWIRNWGLFGHFVPLTTTGGLGLWIGNNPHATGNWMAMPDAYRGLPELTMSARAAHDALAWIAAHPLDWAALTAFKLFRALGVEQFTLARMAQMTHQPDPATLAALFPLLQGSLLALLATAALLAIRLRRPLRGDIRAALIGGGMVQILFVSLPFEFGERHRFFLMPFLFLVVAATLAAHHAPLALATHRMTRHLRHRRRRSEEHHARPSPARRMGTA